MRVEAWKSSRRPPRPETARQARLFTPSRPCYALDVTIDLGVLISGTGSNLGAILDAIDRGALDARVVVVVSNKADAPGLDRARVRGIPALVVDHKAFGSREDFDRAIVSELTAHGARWVVLAGFMRVVTQVLLSAFEDKVINIHPALLPAFPGVDGQAQALAYGVKITGCTVHLVDVGVDTGPIIAQAAIPVLDEDDRATLAARLLREEHALLVRALTLVASGDLEIVKTSSGRRRVRSKSPTFFFGGLP